MDEIDEKVNQTLINEIIETSIPSFYNFSHALCSLDYQYEIIPGMLGEIIQF